MSTSAPTLPPPHPAWRALRLTGALVVLVASLLLALTTARYFSFEPRFAFLMERPFITGNRVWSACFYLHVAGGIICLATAPLLLWNGRVGGGLTLHRALGKVHAVAALGWVGPTGLYLAAFAKGGIAGQLGFLLLGLWFAATSALGIVAIRRGNRCAHVAWMLRSYALILSALTFRALHRLLHELGVEATTNYVASTWASLGLAILAGEWLATRLAPGRVGSARTEAVTP